WEGQTDEGEMGISYDELDRIILNKIDGIDPPKIQLVKDRIKTSEHKRCGAPIFERNR
ncbi:NAD(+) synthetase, partial [Candidatus Margulisiibacteriota bacterium]